MIQSDARWKPTASWALAVLAVGLGGLAAAPTPDQLLERRIAALQTEWQGYCRLAVLQVRSAKLAIEIGDLTGQDPRTIPAVPPSRPAVPDSPPVVAALQAQRDAFADREATRRRIVQAARDTPEYRQAAATAAAHRAALDRADPSTAEAARLVLADRSTLADIDARALATSADWSAAERRATAAAVAVTAARDDQRRAADAADPVASLPPAVAARARSLVSRRASTDAQITAYARVLGNGKPWPAADREVDNLAVLEATVSLRDAQRKGLANADRPPPLDFSPRVPPAVQEAYRTLFWETWPAADPAVAAVKRYEQYHSRDLYDEAQQVKKEYDRVERGRRRRAGEDVSDHP